MKSILVVLSTLLITATTYAETVKLKFTYKGNPLKEHTITVATAGGSGTGVTDNSGEVSISVGALASKTINIYGKKTCDGGEKKFSLEGYVTLDGSNYSHVKMDKIVDEMGSDMGFGGDMLAASWGLTCSGKSESVSGSDTSSETETESSSSLPEPKSREQILAERKTNINNSIGAQEAKIARKKKKLEKDNGKLSGQEKKMLELEIEEHEAKNALNKIQLEEVDREITNGSLRKDDRQEFKARKDEAKTNIKEKKEAQKALKAEMKGGKSDHTDTEEAPEAEEEVENPENETETTTEAPLSDDEIHKLKMDKGKVKMKIKSLEAELNMKENSLERKKAKGNLTDAEIKTKESSIELTKEKIKNAEDRLKEIESKLPKED